MIYLDSPAGVGLSYSRNQDDYTTGDLKTASDTHTFLLKVFGWEQKKNNVEERIRKISFVITYIYIYISENF